MKKFTSALTVTVILFFSQAAQAKIWRINNTPGIVADFTNCTAALSSTSVLNDDTLYIESSAIAYTGFTLSKRLVIIGTGYFLSGANSNTGLQASANSSSFGSAVIVFDSTGSGSTLMGLDNVYLGVGPVLGSATDNITITRCNLSNFGGYYGYTANTSMTGWVITKCYIGSFSFASFRMQDWNINNNIMTSTFDISGTSNTNMIVRNNVIRGGITLYNTYFTNNIITATTFTNVNATIKNNISTGTNLPAGNNNINGATDAALFQGLSGNSTDGQWRLKAGSPAIGAGLTVGAVVSPDCGAFGATDPYKLSGIPSIPSIYSLTVPASIPTGTATMNVTFSTRSNN